MTVNETKEKIKQYEYDAEKIINKFRISLGIIYVVCVLVVSVFRQMDGYGFIPWRSFCFPGVFLAYSVILNFYLRKKETLHSNFKYICVILDMTIVSAAIWTTCTYLEKAPPIPFLSIQSLFYLIFILTNAFRYNANCAYFSGIFAGVCYIIVVMANRNALDLDYFFTIEGKIIPVNFPVYNEMFRVLAMIVIGAITGSACKRHFALFNTMVKTEKDAAHAASRTVEQTRGMAKTISRSTDEIFLSSKGIFSTANSQAVSVQEIESTVRENARIAGEIADKTSSVAAVASKMESDIVHGFSVLERNVEQLENIKRKNDGVISGIVTLGGKIARIRDIIKSINAITDQTKVIAFNAALEAASAGDRGRRFAVVASEVNRLAGDIASLTRQIRLQAEEIQDSSSSLIVSSEESADKINEGNSLIRELEDVFREIHSGAEITANQAHTITVSTQKQQKSSEQINVAIADISGGLSSFIQSTRIATSCAEDLTRLIQELDAVLQ